MLNKNIALIGIGYWGKVHLKYLSLIKKIKIKKIFYLKNRSKISKENLKKYNFTNKIHEIIDDKSISFIDIVTPIETHAELCLKFITTNKKVLVEKPLIMKKKQVLKFEKILKKKNNLMVSYPYEFSKSLLHAKKIINKKILGNIKYISIDMIQCGRFMKYGVNYLLGPHALSILNIFIDLRKLTFKKNDIIKKNRKVETSLISFFLNKKNISNIKLSLNFAEEKSKKEVIIYCERGTIICDLNNEMFTIKAFKFKRTKVRDYSTASIKSIIKKKYDEKNNMRDVINYFVNSKISYRNFNLTKTINNIIS